MSISQVKFLTWVAAAGLFGYMFLFAWNFALGVPAPLYDYVGFLEPDETQARLKLGPSREFQEEVLGSVVAPPPEQDDLVDYDAVQSGLVDLDWSGQPPPAAPVVDELAQEETKPPVTPVSDLLRVLFIRYDSSGVLEGSLAFVKYVHPELAQAPPAASQLYRDDRLPAPFEHVYVAEIETDAIVFGFDDEEREQESLEPADYGAAQSYITMVGDGAEPVLPPVQPLISQRTAPVYRPRETVATGRNQFVIGTEDAAYFEENWQEILSRDVRSTRHRDPVTGRYDGIEITSIAPNSVAARHGVETGDVLKSINGHPVTSKPEAIKFVKNNDDVYDRWEVVVQRLGKDVTMVYEEPPAE